MSIKISDPARLPQPQAYRGSPLLLAIAFLLGVVLTDLWLHHPASPKEAAAAPVGLSAATLNMLTNLAAPVVIRHYSILAASRDADLQSYAGRVTLLLMAMQDASGGKLRLVNLNTPVDTNTAAAGADGLQVFDLDKGGSDYLGLVVASGKNRETFARLDPQWEPALEYDLDRAILRVAIPAPSSSSTPTVAAPNSETLAAIHSLIPDVDATSTETADQIFHAEFMKEISDAGTEMEAQMKVAQERVMAAQTNGAPAELDAAQKNLAKVQWEQGNKIRQIAAELQTRLATFQRLKTGGNNPGK